MPAYWRSSEGKKEPTSIGAARDGPAAHGASFREDEASLPWGRGAGDGQGSLLWPLQSALP